MNPATAQLTKLTLEAFKDINFTNPPVRTWQALLNPTEVSFSRKNQYQATQPTGTPAPEQAFIGGEPDQAQIDLLLDGTGVVGPAGSIGPILDDLLKLTLVHGETHMPHYVHAHWGAFDFQGVLTQADITYKLFDRHGQPLRAAIKLSLRGAVSVKEMEARTRMASPDLHQTWLVEDGDTLDAIAARVYGDPAYWRPLATANRLANPRGLRTGVLLVLPPLAAGR